MRYTPPLHAQPRSPTLSRVVLGLLATCAFGWATHAQAWDPDAGLVPSLTDGASLSATSGTTLTNVLDDDDATHWMSGNCFPGDFMARPDLNPALGVCAGGGCTITGSSSPAGATDGSHYTGVSVSVVSGTASIRVPLAAGTPIAEVAFRGSGGPVNLYVETTGGLVSVGTYGTGDAWNLRRYAAPASGALALVATSTSAFSITDMGAMNGPCTESVTVDLGSVQPVGWVRTRHWAGGHGTATSLSVSADGITYSPVASLDPEALGAVLTEVAPAVSARYLRVTYETDGVDYAKVYLWEVDAWGEDGPYGAVPSPAIAPTDLGTMLGVNGIWGWGTSAYSDTTTAGRGPSHWAPVASYARNYHNMDWDVADPDDVPDYSRMATAGTYPTFWWLDWDREYRAWNDSGLPVLASIQFLDTTFPERVWDHPYDAGYRYAEAFARHFGPTYGTGDVFAMEAGNEPWYNFSAGFYAEVLRGMADGARAGDPLMVVMPAAFQALDADLYGPTGGNYMGDRVTPAAAANLSALNTHAYSYATDGAGVRVGVHPEDPRSTSWEVLSALRWRDANMPTAPLYLTEWGWDSDGVGETCTGTECVTERAQALYAVRGALLWNRLGIERATWFFYANDLYCASLYCRSGLTGSGNVAFAPKMSYVAFQALQARIGDRRVVGVLKEDEDAWVYLLGDASGTVSHIAAWRPAPEADSDLFTVALDVSLVPTDAFELDGVNPDGGSVPLPFHDGEYLYLDLSVVPLIVAVEDIGTGDDGGGGTDGADGGSDGGGDGTDGGTDGGSDGGSDGGDDGSVDTGDDGTEMHFDVDVKVDGCGGFGTVTSAGAGVLIGIFGLRRRRQG